MAAAANAFDGIVAAGASTPRGARLSDGLPAVVAAKPLYTAAHAGHGHECQTLLLQRADVNEQEHGHGTALHAAVFGGHTDLVRLLLESRASANARDAAGQTPLFFAPTRVICDLLAASRADANALNDTRQSALHLAAHAGLTDAVEWLTLPGRVSPALLNMPDNARCTPADYAVWSRSKTTAKLLRSKGARRNKARPVRQAASAPARRFRAVYGDACTSAAASSPQPPFAVVPPPGSPASVGAFAHHRRHGPQPVSNLGCNSGGAPLPSVPVQQTSLAPQSASASSAPVPREPVRPLLPPPKQQRPRPYQPPPQPLPEQQLHTQRTGMPRGMRPPYRQRGGRATSLGSVLEATQEEEEDCEIRSSSPMLRTGGESPRRASNHRPLSAFAVMGGVDADDDLAGGNQQLIAVEAPTTQPLQVFWRPEIVADPAAELNAGGKSDVNVGLPRSAARPEHGAEASPCTNAIAERSPAVEVSATAQSEGTVAAVLRGSATSEPPANACELLAKSDSAGAAHTNLRANTASFIESCVEDAVSVMLAENLRDDTTSDAMTSCASVPPEALPFLETWEAHLCTRPSTASSCASADRTPQGVRRECEEGSPAFLRRMCCQQALDEIAEDWLADIIAGEAGDVINVPPTSPNEVHTLHMAATQSVDEVLAEAVVSVAMLPSNAAQMHDSDSDDELFEVPLAQHLLETRLSCGLNSMVWGQMRNFASVSGPVATHAARGDMRDSQEVPDRDQDLADSLRSLDDRSERGTEKESHGTPASSTQLFAWESRAESDDVAQVVVDDAMATRLQQSVELSVVDIDSVPSVVSEQARGDAAAALMEALRNSIQAEDDVCSIGADDDVGSISGDCRCETSARGFGQPLCAEEHAAPSAGITARSVVEAIEDTVGDPSVDNGVPFISTCLEPGYALNVSVCATLESTQTPAGGGCVQTRSSCHSPWHDDMTLTTPLEQQQQLDHRATQERVLLVPDTARLQHLEEENTKLKAELALITRHQAESEVRAKLEREKEEARRRKADEEFCAKFKALEEETARLRLVEAEIGSLKVQMGLLAQLATSQAEARAIAEAAAERRPAVASEADALEHPQLVEAELSTANREIAAKVTADALQAWEQEDAAASEEAVFDDPDVDKKFVTNEVASSVAAVEMAADIVATVEQAAAEAANADIAVEPSAASELPTALEAMVAAEEVAAAVAAREVTRPIYESIANTQRLLEHLAARSQAGVSSRVILGAAYRTAADTQCRTATAAWRSEALSLSAEALRGTYDAVSQSQRQADARLARAEAVSSSRAIARASFCAAARRADAGASRYEAVSSSRAVVCAAYSTAAESERRAEATAARLDALCSSEKLRRSTYHVVAEAQLQAAAIISRSEAVVVSKPILLAAYHAVADAQQRAAANIARAEIVVVSRFVVLATYWAAAKGERRVEEMKSRSEAVSHSMQIRRAAYDGIAEAQHQADAKAARSDALVASTFVRNAVYASTLEVCQRAAWIDARAGAVSLSSCVRGATYSTVWQFWRQAARGEAYESSYAVRRAAYQFAAVFVCQANARDTRFQAKQSVRTIIRHAYSSAAEAERQADAKIARRVAQQSVQAASKRACNAAAEAQRRAASAAARSEALQSSRAVSRHMYNAVAEAQRRADARAARLEAMRSSAMVRAATYDAVAHAEGADGKMAEQAPIPSRSGANGIPKAESSLASEAAGGAFSDLLTITLPDTACADATSWAKAALKAVYSRAEANAWKAQLPLVSKMVTRAAYEASAPIQCINVATFGGLDVALTPEARADPAATADPDLTARVADVITAAVDAAIASRLAALGNSVSSPCGRYPAVNESKSFAPAIAAVGSDSLVLAKAITAATYKAISLSASHPDDERLRSSVTHREEEPPRESRSSDADPERFAGARLEASKLIRSATNAAIDKLLAAADARLEASELVMSATAAAIDKLRAADQFAADIPQSSVGDNADVGQASPHDGPTFAEAAPELPMSAPHDAGQDLCAAPAAAAVDVDGFPQQAMDAAETPDALIVSSPLWRDELCGIYEVDQQRNVNGAPVWAQQNLRGDMQRILYLGGNDFWIIGRDPVCGDGVRCVEGCARCPRHGSGKLPHELPNTWERVLDSGAWTADPTIAVTTQPPRSSFAADESVTNPESLERPETQSSLNFEEACEESSSDMGEAVAQAFGESRQETSGSPRPSSPCVAMLADAAESPRHSVDETSSCAAESVELLQPQAAADGCESDSLQQASVHSRDEADCASATAVQPAEDCQHGADRHDDAGSAKDIPRVFFLQSPHGQQECEGRYDLVPGQLAQGQPVWRKASGEERWLYRGTDGAWFVADSTVATIGFQCAQGYLHTRSGHVGMPDELVGSWERVTGQVWQPDPAIRLLRDEVMVHASAVLRARVDAEDVPTVPPVLYLETPHGQQGCAGRYELVEGRLAQGMPVWRKLGDGERWLYCGANGSWFVADADVVTEGFSCSKGYIHWPGLVFRFGRDMPDALTQRWERVDGNAWRADPAIRFTREAPASSSSGR